MFRCERCKGQFTDCGTAVRIYDCVWDVNYDYENEAHILCQICHQELLRFMNGETYYEKRKNN
jgi:hypothetical protein